MTAIITITSPAQLDRRYQYWGISPVETDEEALDKFKQMLIREKLDPAYDTTGYRHGKTVWFVMNYGRAHES